MSDVTEPPSPGSGNESRWHRVLDRSGELLERIRHRRISLRTRILLSFALGGLALSAFLAATTYSFTKSRLVRQRDQSALTDAYKSASLVTGDLRSNPTDVMELLSRLQTLGVERPVLYYRGSWYAGRADFGPNALPEALKARINADGRAARMVTRVRDEPVIAVGIPLEKVDASYFEFSSLEELQATLSSVGRALIGAGVITTSLGLLLGALAARRAVRPLADAAQAAQSIAGGRLDTRLDPGGDPDLRGLANSFNNMASALQQRVERDARFASDVSHELRSPLMTLAASVEVLQARRDDMPERAQTALDLLVGDVMRFQGLVEDLLEISRFDAGAIHLNLDELLVGEFVRQAVNVSSARDTPVVVTERGEQMLIRGDRRRLARVVANLIDNARLHGSGAIAISVGEAQEPEPISNVWIAVEDEGAGVPEEERSLVFERFARGGAAGRRATSEGAGLGLALVAEHVRLHGGKVWVEDRLDREPGARFVIELPAEEVAE
ncbi:MAG: HAMP domain-containing sensor histidine kinase [Actinomycetota bacterium]